MDAAVDLDPAAHGRIAERRRRRLGIPLREAEQPWLADRALGEQPARLAIGPGVAPPEADVEREPAVIGLRGQPLIGLRVERQRLLAEHVLAGGQRRRDQRLVQRRRRRDQHGVDVVALERLLEVGVDRAPGLQSRARPRPGRDRRSPAVARGARAAARAGASRPSARHRPARGPSSAGARRSCAGGCEPSLIGRRSRRTRATTLPADARATHAHAATGYRTRRIATFQGGLVGNDRARLRIGLIGAGLVGQAAHAHFLWDERERFELAALADPSAAVRSAVGDRYGIPERHAGLDDLLGLGLDAVVIGVPDAFHADVACGALEAGLHVLCEKPLALSLAECDRIAAARDASGRVLQVGTMKRFDPAYLRLLELLPERAARRALPLGRGARPRPGPVRRPPPDDGRLRSRAGARRGAAGPHGEPRSARPRAASRRPAGRAPSRPTCPRSCTT